MIVISICRFSDSLTAANPSKLFIKVLCYLLEFAYSRAILITVIMQRAYCVPGPVLSTLQAFHLILQQPCEMELSLFSRSKILVWRGYIICST